MRLRAVLEAFSEAILLVDRAGTICHANAAALRLLRKGAQELIDHPIGDVGPWQEDPTARSRLLSALASASSGISVTLALPVGGKDHSTSSIEIALTPTREPSGVLTDILVELKPTNCAGTNAAELEREVGLRHRAEEANAKFAAIIESSNDAIIGHHLDGTIVTWNQGAQRLFGYTAEEAKGASISMLVPPGTPDELPGIVQSVRRGEPLQPMELERVRKNGTRVFVSLAASPIKDEAGRIAGISRIARDITQRKQMEHALRESEARSRAILDSAVDGVVTINELGQIRSFNRAAERLFGYRASEVIGRNISMLMPDPYRREHDGYMRNYLQTGIPRIIGIGREVVALRKDGTVFPMDLSVSEVHLGDQRLFTGIIHDLTERAALEKQILEISDAEKRRIGQDLHDGLGQSLTGIGFKTKALETKLAAKGLPEAESARQLAELVTQAIMQSRAIARGLQPVSVERGGLVAALSELASSLSDLFKIDCVFDCPQRVPISDTGTAMHLYRIAQEAANNALKHARASRITISLTCSAGPVKLAITDDGNGFAANTAATGTGLHIMRYRAAMIGGTLGVESRPGAGTTVSCSLPEHVVAKAGASDAS